MDPNDYEIRVEQLVRKITVASDPQLVDYIAAEVLNTRPAEVLANLLLRIGRDAYKDRHRIVYMGMVRLALDGHSIPDSVRQEVYSILASEDHEALVRFLLPLPARRTLNEGEEEFDPILDDMSLGMKKWKARLHDRDLLLRLGRDPEPSVMRILLDNPKIIERDVIHWAARRPARKPILMAIARHRKWSLRRRVQEAIARNPYTPGHLAAAYMPLFGSRLLKLIAADPSLQEIVRRAASDVLALRGRTDDE